MSQTHVKLPFESHFRDSYLSLYGEEAIGGNHSLGIQFFVAGPNMPDLQDKAIQSACYDAVKLVKEAIHLARTIADPEAQKRKAAERASLVACFPGSIFVEEIPNGYACGSGDSFYPWYRITTTIGHFTIGWRRSVINLDWSATRGTKTAEELFPKEDVTKGDRYIHAYGYDKAAQYVATIMRESTP